MLEGDFVSTDEGTGIVHMAPGFGEDDQRACEQAGIAVVCPVDSRARFTFEVPPYEGLQVFEANRVIIADLRHKVPSCAMRLTSTLTPIAGGPIPRSYTRRSARGS